MLGMDLTFHFGLGRGVCSTPAVLRNYVSTLLALASGAVLATALASCGSSSNPAGDPIDAGSDEAAPDAAPEARPMLADYAAPIQLPQGADGVKHIDVEATLDRLAGAHINTYAYLIYGGGDWGAASAETITQAQWDDLPAFVDAAAARNIEVFVYLVPPSESFRGSGGPVGERMPAYKPFDWDYIAWARALGEVAKAHPNLRGIVMDDFAGNTAEWRLGYAFSFSPSYVASMMTEARASAPWLTFSVILYYGQYMGNTAISTSFRDVIDGVILPYAGMSVGDMNTSDPSAAENEGRIVSSLVKCHSGQTCYQIAFPPATTSTAGQYGAISQTLSVSPAESYRLSFWINDDFVAGVSGGFHVMQALIDDVVVAERDVVNFAGWQKVDVDVTAALTGKTSAKLTLRMAEAQGVANFRVAGWFDDVVGEGFTVEDGGFEATAGGSGPWVPSKVGDAFSMAPVRSLNFIYMTYASRVYVEIAREGENYRTSAAYVGTVLDAALKLMREGIVDGSMVYVLNLSGADNGGGDPAAYEVVAERYGAY